MTDDSAGQFKQGLMDVSPSFVSDPQAAKVMKPCQGALDNPARFPQATAVRCATLGQQGFDAAPF